MTWEAYEHSIEVHRRLGEESLAERVFRKSMKTRENEGCKPTPASLLEDIRKTFMEHWNGGLNTLRCEKRDKHRHEVVLPCQGEGKGESYCKRFSEPENTECQPRAYGIRHNHRDRQSLRKGI